MDFNVGVNVSVNIVKKEMEVGRADVMAAKV